MDKSNAEEHAATVVIVRACQWTDHRKNVQSLKHGPQRDRVRALGRYEVAGEQLADSVDRLRAAKQAIDDAKEH